MNFWSSLEWFPGLAALPAVWLDYVGQNFNHFKNLCFLPDTRLPKFVTCPRRCGCHHYIVLRHDKTAAVGICHCDTHHCPDIPLTIEEITPLVVDWRRLGYAISRALHCTPSITDLSPASTKQIGSWSAAAVPLILTIQYDRPPFRSAVAELAASIHKPFILLTPTMVLPDAACLAYLHDAGAILLDLESTLAFTPEGSLTPLRPPEELFAQFPTHPAPRSTLHDCQLRSTLPAQRSTKFALRKNLGVWHLIFDGQEAFIRHERGLLYIHWLLYHPDQTPIHAIDLMAKIPEIYRQQLGLPALTDPVTGKTVTLDSGARLQERSLALDDRQSMRALFKKQKELEALLDSDDASEPEKAEALRELEQLYDWQRHHAAHSKDAAHKLAQSVRKAVIRLQRHLQTGAAPATASNQPLIEFAHHIRKQIQYGQGPRAGTPNTASPTHPPAHFTYETLPVVTWQP
jgi:hypothetical protein